MNPLPANSITILQGRPLDQLLELAPEDFPRPKQLTLQTRTKHPVTLLAEAVSHGLAIVGTRNPQLKSLQHLKKTLTELKGTQTIVISGMARGIDAAAHEGAIENGLKTIAFLGAGISVNYPQTNSRLREAILNHGGLLVSEFPDQEPPRPAHFLARNRWLAYFSKATWVVEGMTISGSLNTAAWARQIGRDLYATPCFPGDPALSGNQRLLAEQYATPLFSANSLQGTWLNLQIQEPEKVAHFRPKNGLERDILKMIRLETSRSGVVHWLNLREKCIEVGWDPAAFQMSFQSLIQHQIIKDQQGWITLLQPALRSL
jgi:DNA protecting protein DprA